MSLVAADVLEDFAMDDAIRVIVLSGAGDKAFVSGGDISKFEQARATKEQVESYNKTGDRFRTLLKDSAKPTIAMIRGYCLGGGMAIALNCDLRICTEDASFGIPAAKLGIGYAADRLGHLVELVGPSAAKDLMFTEGAAMRRTPCAWESSITSWPQMSSNRSSNRTPGTLRTMHRSPSSLPNASSTNM
jgi:enoyl-CoA hydratase/carnithine racemase